MIEKPPRSSAELSPRLRAISEYAVDQFDEAENLPLIRPVIVRRVGLPLLLVLVAILARLGLYYWEGYLAAPSIHATRAAQFLAMARQSEEEAKTYRDFAALGKSGPVTPGGFAFSPQQALLRAQLMDRTAAGLRKQAYFEERRNQNFPVP